MSEGIKLPGVASSPTVSAAIPEKTSASDDWELQRDEAKAAGDAAFRAKQYEKAIQEYTTALSVDPENATILSNRSAAYLLNNQKSKALYDAQKCVELKTMGVKGQSRLAAALQALGRWEAALKEWKIILQAEPQHPVALKGVMDCEKMLEEIQKKMQEEETEAAKQQQTKAEEGGDELDDFFDEVEEATEAVVKQKQQESEDKPTEAIKNHKKDLGTAKNQIARLLAPNYKWRNLNPFFVLDISHLATDEEISRRYKALSLLLHPDKNRDDPKAQEAYEEVLQAKAKLSDENKANHVRQLVDQGMKQGKIDWGNQHKKGNLEEFQSKAVQRIFAQVEQKRKEVEDRQRKQEQRERDQEEEVLTKERETRKFDKNWKEEERVDKRIGHWRDFQQTKKSKPPS